MDCLIPQGGRQSAPVIRHQVLPSIRVRDLIREGCRTGPGQLPELWEREPVKRHQGVATNVGGECEPELRELRFNSNHCHI